MYYTYKIGEFSQEKGSLSGLTFFFLDFSHSNYPSFNYVSTHKAPPPPPSATKYKLSVLLSGYFAVVSGV